MPGRHAKRSAAVWIGTAAVSLLVVGGGLVATAYGGGSGRPVDDDRAPAGSGILEEGAGAAPQEARPAIPIPESRDRIVIHATGDVSLDPAYIPAFVANGYSWAWSGMGGLFRRDDLTIINHECPSTDIQAPIPKEFNFRCDPTALPAAKAAGVDVANLANNHGYDQGPRGLLDSIRNLRAAGIAPVGAGHDERAAERPAVFDLSGWTVAVVGFGEVLDPLYQTAGPNKPGTATGHSLPLKLRAIRAADRVADIVIVTIHWGVELDTEPRDYQVAEGHAMVDAGADMIFGHHPHRLQPVSVYRGRPIFWSLGNFVWPALSEEGSTTAVARVTVTPTGRFAGSLLPAYIVSDGHPVLRRSAG
jgi:capsule synthesis protein PGA_cap